MKNQIWTIILSILFSFFIISTMAVIVSRSGLIYSFAYGKSQSPIINESVRLDMSSNVREYLTGPGELHYFNEQEKSHMQDVKQILDAFFHFSLFMFGLGISIFIFKRELFYRSLKNAAFICLSFCALLILLVIMGFDKTFSSFHAIFFPQGNWQFPFGSELIAVFPITFFFNIAMILIGLIVLVSLIILSVYYLYLLNHNIYN